MLAGWKFMLHSLQASWDRALVRISNLTKNINQNSLKINQFEHTCDKDYYIFMINRIFQKNNSNNKKQVEKPPGFELQPSIFPSLYLTPAPLLHILCGAILKIISFYYKHFVYFSEKFSGFQFLCQRLHDYLQFKNVQTTLQFVYFPFH